MRIQSGGKANVVFKAEENVFLAETPQRAGFIIEGFEDPVFFVETELFLCQRQSLEGREI